MVQPSHPYRTTGRTIALTGQTSVGPVMSLLFNMLSRFVIAFIPRSKHLLFYFFTRDLKIFTLKQAPFNFMAAATIYTGFGAQENKFYHCFHCFPIYLPWSYGTRCYDLSFMNVLSQIFHSSLSPSSRGFLVPLCFLSLVWCHLHIWGYWYFSQKPGF